MRGGDQRLDQLDHVGEQVRGLAQAGVDEAVRDPRPCRVGDQLAAPLDRHMLVDHQVDGQGAQLRADGQRRVRDAGRPVRDVLAAAAAHSAVEVVLDPLRGRLGDLQLLAGPGHSRIPGISQVRAALARPGRVPVAGVVGLSPGHRRSRRAGLLAPLPLLLRLPLRGPPLLARRLASRRVIPRRRHRGIPAVTGQGTLQPGNLRPQFSEFLCLSAELGFQDSDPLIPGSAATAIRVGRGQAGHKS